MSAKKIDKKLTDKFGKYKVFLVNGSAIRDLSQSYDEFNEFATHFDFPKLIPDKEIWIAKDVSRHESQFFIHNGLSQYEAKEKKIKNYYDYALKRERREREVVDNIKFKPHNVNKKPPDKVYDEYYCGIASPGDDVEVWLVNGEIVRDLFKTDFVLAGHGFVYPWIPNNEIWVERDLGKEEVPITILHEYTERSLMKYKHLTYNKAHNIAAKVDWHHRGKFDKPDVMALDKEKALEMADKYL